MMVVVVVAVVCLGLAMVRLWVWRWLQCDQHICPVSGREAGEAWGERLTVTVTVMGRWKIECAGLSHFPPSPPPVSFLRLAIRNPCLSLSFFFAATGRLISVDEDAPRNHNA